MMTAIVLGCEKAPVAGVTRHICTVSEQCSKTITLSAVDHALWYSE